MTYEQLVVLDAVVTQGGFRNAAEHLYKSQSAISIAIKKLEDESGIQLFNRDNYRPNLTQDGEVFYRQALKVLRGMQQLQATAQQLKGEQEAEVRISITATCPIKNVLEVIGDTNQQYPDTKIKLKTEMMGGAVERLLDGQADIIIASNDGVPFEQVDSFPFTTTVITPVAHREYELASMGSNVSSEQMENFVQVVVTGTSSEKYEQSRDIIQASQQWTVSDFATKREIILAQMGWGGLPKHLVQEDLDRGDLVELNLINYPPRKTQLYVIRKKDAGLGIVSQDIFEKLKLMTA
ncbi:LysR family transcriptional regulator [Alteromonadaceae bacterium M269]|nr:LysR family transcriptional regulator [Alteromonadaceae bacterium M269]